MRKNTFVVVSLIFFMPLFFGCHSEKEPQEYQLVQEDLKFSELSRTSGRNTSFLHYCADNAVLLADNHLPISGRQQIQSYLETSDDSTYVLTWEPLFAQIAESGELGYTYGVFFLEWKEKSEKNKDSYGTYTTIWEKNTEGQWRFVLDTGNKGLGENESDWKNYLKERKKK